MKQNKFEFQFPNCSHPTMNESASSQFHYNFNKSAVSNQSLFDDECSNLQPEYLLIKKLKLFNKYFNNEISQVDKDINHYGYKISSKSMFSLKDTKISRCNRMFQTNLLYSHHFRDVKLPISFDHKQIKSCQSDFILNNYDSNWRGYFNYKQNFLDKFQCIECRFDKKGRRRKTSLSVPNFHSFRINELRNMQKNSKVYY